MLSYNLLKSEKVPPPPCDPNWDNLLYASHLTDNLDNLIVNPNITVTFNSSPTIDIVPDKGRFGGGGAYSSPVIGTDGTGYIHINPSSYVIRSIDFFFNLDNEITEGGTKGNGLFSIWGGNLWAQRVSALSANAGRLRLGGLNGEIILDALSLNLWYHMEVNFTITTEPGSDGHAYVYLNGILVYDAPFSGSTGADSIQIGKGNSFDNNMGGTISDLRVYSVMQHTSNFTPPTEPFPEIQC